MSRIKVLILGATGMLGQSLVRYLRTNNVLVHGIARKNADYNLDIINDLDQVRQLIKRNNYDVIINTVALVNLDFCEKNPEQAYMFNTFIAGELAKICDESGIYFVQISTDHYYTRDGNLLHSENAKIILLNEYSKTKYLAEQLVGIYQNTLVVRTNIVGFRYNSTPTFVEWLLNTLQTNKQLTGYTDMYTSSIDVEAFVEILYLLIEGRETGIWNVAADGVLSKYEFISAMANKFNKIHLVESGKLTHNNVKRGESLGLCIKKLKNKYPHIEIPTALQVVDRLYNQYIKKDKVTENEL